MDYLFNVNFNENGKGLFFLANYEVKKGEHVLATTPRGLELGTISSNPVSYIPKEGEEIPYSYILRIADDSDIKVDNINKKEERNIITAVQQEANKLNLNMKVTSAQYTFDRTKLTICYLADERVDFRDLLKVLASTYHCRLELRQIGPRDKAKIVGGIGICGLPLCCSTFLNEFDGISITMAKNQMLALNIPKLSGHCGKLICCLKYEDETYTAEKEGLPKIGLRVQIEDKIYRISSINIITKVVRLESPDNILNVPLKQIEDKIITNYNSNAPQAFNQANALKSKSEFNSRFKNNKVNDTPKEDNNDQAEIEAPLAETRVEESNTPTSNVNQNRNQNNHQPRFNKFNKNRHNQNNQSNKPNEETNKTQVNNTNTINDEDNEFNLIAKRLYTGDNSKPNNNYHPRNNNHRFHHNNKPRQNNSHEEN